MKTSPLISRISLFAFAIVAACCLFIGCVYSVPITDKPTGPIDNRLLGNWKSADGKSKMKVVKLDDRNYIVSLDGDLYQVYHSDVAHTPFVTVKDLEATTTKFYYYNWRLGDDGTLHLRLVNDKVIPDETATSAAVRKLLKKNLENPDLFNEDSQMIRDQ